MKHFLYRVFLSLAITLTFGVLIWVLTLHGSIPMLRRDSLVRAIFVFPGLLAVLLLIMAIWRRKISIRRTAFSRWLLLPIWSVTVLCILFSVAAFGYISDYPYTPTGDLPSRLLIQNSPPATSGPHVRFAASGDAHFGAGTNRLDVTTEMVNLIANPENGFDYFFSLGDLVDMGTKNANWQEALTALGPITSRLPTGFIPGNHDTLFFGVKRFQEYSLPGAHLTGKRPLYYQVDVGSVHFFILDVEWSAERFDKNQAEWLDNHLRTIPAQDWKIVLSHGYYYSYGYNYHGFNWSDNPETISIVTPIFEKNGVDLVLSGHNHHMEHLNKNGVTYVICGAFGGKPDTVRTHISPASLWYRAGEYGFVDVKIDNDQASVFFRGPQNQEIKSLIITKNQFTRN